MYTLRIQIYKDEHNTHHVYDYYDSIGECIAAIWNRPDADEYLIVWKD